MTPASVFIGSAIVVAVLLTVVWVLSVRLKDVSIVDPVWGPGFALVALYVALDGPGCAGRRWLLFAMTAIWGLRLGLHLIRRKLGEPDEDRRYAVLRARNPDRFWLRSLYTVFLAQGVLIWVIAMPQQAASGAGGSLGPLIAPGIVVFLVGLAFEAIGDDQLRRFRADPASAGQVMDRGLWRYTRHPNYFGDFCVWWGIWLVALPAGGTWWTVFSPLIMSFLLIRGSGKELLERDIATRRPGYAEYVRRTSGFLPRPPRS